MIHADRPNTQCGAGGATFQEHFLHGMRHGQRPAAAASAHTFRGRSSISLISRSPARAHTIFGSEERLMNVGRSVASMITSLCGVGGR